jgi:hypothetical protein
LLVEYQNSKTETKEIKDAQTQQIKSYLVKVGKNKLSLSDLEQKSNDSGGGDPKNPTNYWPWIGGGIILALLVAIIIYLLTKNKKKTVK